MSEFKRIPGFQSKYAIDMDGRVLDIKAKKIIPQSNCLMKYRDQIGQKRVPLNGKFILVARLMIVAYMEADIDKHAYFEYIDGDKSNTNIYNIRWNYQRVSKGKLKNNYIDYLAKLQKDSLCAEIKD